MIRVDADTTNTFYINLSNQVEFSNYLFVFTGSGIDGQKATLLPESGSYLNRAHKFTLIESATEDLANGTISLPNAEDYAVSMYNKETADLTIPDAEPAWRGFVRVYRNSTTKKNYDPDINKAAYDPR